ncbi:hypothetical protein [Oceanisphaera sp. IT1-181]|uniref:hypothetical protein n=1 Tax=Oceanisphaera sp. IT1-181 TaxID=3081199 RepID=UPI0029CA4983|nr:hypothetical protein [Oceanisphaera sp. IT1-181]
MNSSKRVTMAGALLALTLTACGHPPTAEEQLAVALAEFTEQADLEYQHAFMDLNHDGVEDALVLLAGSDWCGSGGCALLVLKGQVLGQQAEGSSFEVISRSTVTRPPIRVGKSESEGWQNLIVHSDGAEKLLQFDGNRYPPNPSMQPSATPEQLDGANILLP